MLNRWMKQILMIGTSSIELTANDQPKRVLLVEDNRVSRLVAERLLLRWGYHVSLAENGMEALKHAALNTHDLILMNLHMPGMDGAETARMIRRLDAHYKAVPIVAFSANQLGLQPVDSPFTDFLAVPYMPEQLKNLLQQHLAEPADAHAALIKKRLDVVSGADPLFRQQLVELFARNCQELVDDLVEGRLDNAEYLRQVRHKHKSSLRLLELYSFEAALDNLQQMLDQQTVDAALLQQRKQAVVHQAMSVMEELNLMSA